MFQQGKLSGKAGERGTPFSIPGDWMSWSTCRLSDYQPLQDGFGVEAAGVFFFAFGAFLAFSAFRAFSVFNAFRTFSFAQTSEKCGKLPI